MNLNKNFRLILFLFVLVTASCTSNSQISEPSSLKDAFADKFYLGTALNENQITGKDSSALEIVTREFNSIVAENCMKSEELQPEEGVFDFSLADQFVEFGEKHNMHTIGHTLIWHSQAPPWFFSDSEGKDVSREVLIDRMKNHISTVVGRYKGRVKGWDVVNETILDDGSWRKSKFYEIIGEDFVKIAFELTHEADPEAELYYNDYSMAEPGKREGVIRMVKSLQEKGVRIDGIGMQGHVGLDYPELDEFEKSIVEFATLGVKVMITELDITVLPSPWDNAGAEISTGFEYEERLDPYPNGLPDSIYTEFHNRCLDFFNLFLKHQEKISRVTLWGVNDRQSWKNDWPIMGRTDYALLFDRNNQPKPVVKEIIAAANENQVKQ